LICSPVRTTAEATMLAHGIKLEILTGLVRVVLATAEPDAV
jgi:hypothetical protein